MPLKIQQSTVDLWLAMKEAYGRKQEKTTIEILQQSLDVREFALRSRLKASEIRIESLTKELDHAITSRPLAH